MSEFWEWLLGVLTTTGAIGTVGYLFRDTLTQFFTKAIEHRFEKRLETFKGELRDNEKELEQIRSFLTSARRDRDSALQAKRLEAAETLLRARHSLSQMSMLVEYMKILNGEKILEDGDNPKITGFIETIMKPFNVDDKIKEINTFDETGARLYLSDKTLKAFEAYKSIIIQATMMMKIYSIPLRDRAGLMNVGELSKMIIEIVPTSKEGFEKFGEGYAYYWTKYFHDEILRLLRQEVSGAEDLTRDARSVEQLALETRQAQINVRSALAQKGLPDTLIKTDENAAASSTAAEKLPW